MRAVKRLLFCTLLLLISCGGLNSKQRASSGTALAALQKVKAATEVGVNYNNYGQLLIDAKAAVNEATRILPDGELKTELNAAMDGYADAAQVWGFKIQNNGFFYERGEPKPITDKYNFRDKIDSYGFTWGETVLQIIWAATKLHLDKVESLLR